jgi:hypothetical protein
VAAAGLGGIAATTAAEEPPSPPAPAPPDPASATRLPDPPDVTPRLPKRRGFTILHVRGRHRLSLRTAPHGRVFTRIGTRTDFGSPQTLTVVRRRGRWLGVTTSERRNGRIAWVDGRAGVLGRHRTRLSLHVDRSRGRIWLKDGKKTVRTARVGTGRRGSPTPTGRFAVTDKMAGRRFRGVYGCCILALSGKQENPPQGWRGGLRLAIHGTSGRSGTFTGGSAGCVRADPRTLRVLMRQVPLGTPVFVRS